MFSGMIPALITPFTTDGRIDTTTLCEIVEFLLSRGMNGLYLCGSTGEGLLLTEEERRMVVETAVEQVARRVPVIVHVGALATPTSERLAQHAREVGADAVASVPPFYYGVGVAGIENHFRRIAQAARGLPLYVYNIPDATQVRMTTALVKTLFEQNAIRGIKYTSYDMLTLRDIIDTCPGLNVFSGPDEMLLPFLVMGVHGGIGTTYNCVPRLIAALYRAWQSGDIPLAQKLQFQLDRIILVLARYGIIPATKAAMQLQGLDCCKTRAPLLPLTPEQSESLADDLKAVGFFDWTGEDDG